MSDVEDRQSEGRSGGASAANVSGIAPDDSRIIRALQEYQVELRAGHKPSRSAFQARYPDIADALAECLDGLEYVHVVAPQLSDPGPAISAARDINPEGPLGDFRIVREIGRGGMGVVYEAVQISLGRRVALKVLPFAAALDPKQLQRFKNEAHAAALLHHTNIVPVISVGCERGVHFYAMQYIEGQPLSQVIHELRELAGRGPASGAPENQPTGASVPSSGSPLAAACVSRSEKSSERETQAAGLATTPHLVGTTLPSTNGPAFFRTVAQLGVQAAEALEHAHDEGVVHRDIKPANLLVDAKGKLWITDFGLARCRDNAGLTMTGDVVGTLRYMSPEQALAKRPLIDHRTDLYSLGVTLYELLTLEPAFSSSDRQELLQQIAFEEPRPPRRLNKPIPAELETIVLKAMEKNPAERYATAQELADDLRRFLEDKPIRAKRPTVLQRAVKWCRRHKSAMRAVAVILILAVVGLAASTWLIWLEKEQTKVALANAKANGERAQQNLDTARQILDAFVDNAEQRLPRERELTPVDRQLLEKARTFYERIAHQDSSDPGVHLQMAKDYLRVGGIHEQLGQDEQAAAAYQQALAVSAKLDAEYPDRADYRYMLARSYSIFGGQWGTLIPAERRPEFLEGYAEAVRLLEELVREDPTNLDYRHDLGLIYGRLGYERLFHLERPFAEAEEPVRRALEIREQLVEEKPSVFLYRQELGMSLGNLGAILMATSRFQEAEEVVCRERQVRQKVVDDFPAEPDAWFFLADAYMDLAKLRDRMGKLQEAMEAHRQEVRLRKKVAAEFPSLGVAPLHLAWSTERLGDALVKAGAQDEAIAAYEEAIATCKQVIRPRGDQPKAFVCWGRCLAHAGARNEAVAAWIQAALGADNVDVTNRVAWFLATTSEPPTQNSEYAVQLAKKAVGLAPQNGPFWTTLGGAYYRAGQWQGAVAALKKAMQLRSGGDSADWFFLAMAQQQLGDAEEARHWYDQAVQWMDKNKPRDEELHRFCAEAAARLGFAEEALNK
jgi:serine/threonine protein kinase/Flp pilus assembly protein TadD